MTLTGVSAAPDPLGSDPDQSYRIQEAVYDAIVEQRLPPGTKLTEADVGAAFDVSRTIARRALQALAHVGIVTIERNRGASVSRPDAGQAREVFAARRLVEPSLARLAAKACTKADISTLRGHLNAELEALRKGERRSAIRLSGEFHLHIAEMASNAVLARFLRDLIARTSLIVALYGRSGVSTCGTADHRRIVALLGRHDEEGAAEAMLHHLGHIEADLHLRDQPAQTLDLTSILRAVRQ